MRRAVAPLTCRGTTGKIAHVRSLKAPPNLEQRHAIALHGRCAAARTGRPDVAEAHAGPGQPIASSPVRSCWNGCARELASLALIEAIPTDLAFNLARLILEAAHMQQRRKTHVSYDDRGGMRTRDGEPPIQHDGTGNHERTGNNCLSTKQTGQPGRTSSWTVREGPGMHEMRFGRGDS